TFTPPLSTLPGSSNRKQRRAKERSRRRPGASLALYAAALAFDLLTAIAARPWRPSIIRRDDMYSRTCGDGASWVLACEYLRLLRVMLSKMTDNVFSGLLHFLIGILETFIGRNAHRLEVKIKQGIVTIPRRRVFHGGNDPPRLLGKD